MTGLSQLGQAALLTIFSVAGPILAVILVIGTLVSVFMTVTQINEPTLSFIPKFLATAAVMALLGPWLLRRPERLRGGPASAFAGRTDRVRPGPGDGGAAAAAARTGHSLHFQHLLRPDDPAGRAVHGQTDGLLGLSGPASADHAAALVAQCRSRPRHPAARLSGTERRGPGH